MSMPAKKTNWDVAGRSVQVSSLDTVYWPDDGLTKGDLLAYYREIAPAMLPYLQDRPVTLRVFPKGITGSGHYRRDRPPKAPEWLRGADYETATNRHTLRTLIIDDAAGLVWCANTGAIEFHVWSAHLPDLAEPDQAIFDLDPGEDCTFQDVLRGALVVREDLDRLGLRGYPKTSGGRGIHVLIPLAAGYSYETVRDWVSGFAGDLAAAHPTRFSAEGGATHRGDRITIDYAQNSIGRNTAAPYTVRGLPRAPVSTPVTWDEVEVGKINPADFTLRTIPDRVQRLGDLLAPMRDDQQRLPPSIET
jgi:bifunctional non-homologous end joining protein LigD